MNKNDGGIYETRSTMLSTDILRESTPKFSSKENYLIGDVILQKSARIFPF
jgi:hypothetical protein